MNLYHSNQQYLDQMDALFREMDAIQRGPFRRYRRATARPSPRVTVSAIFAIVLIMQMIQQPVED